MDNREIPLGSDAWNVAEGYVKLKILKPLFECDQLRMAALFGSESLVDSIQIQSPSMEAILRIQATKRLHATLSMIITNTIKLIKKNDVKTLQTHKRQLDIAEELFDELQIETNDQRTGTYIIKVNEKFFHNFLAELVRIKESIVEILNAAGLIFPKSEEMDLSTIKENYKDGF